MSVPSGNVENLWADSVFAPVPIRNVFDATVDRLVRAIRLGVLADGEQLPPERELARTFGISRVTLREVIRSLRELGLLESRRGRAGGTFVVSPSTRSPYRPPSDPSLVIDELLDALDLRRVLEPGAAQLAACRVHPAVDRASLRRYLKEATICAPPERGVCNSRLHMAIAALGGSLSVASAVADIRLKVDDLITAFPAMVPNIQRSDRQHAAIVRAVLAGRPEEARQVMEQHVDDTAELVRRMLA